LAEVRAYSRIGFCENCASNITNKAILNPETDGGTLNGVCFVDIVAGCVRNSGPGDGVGASSGADEVQWG
jgi:hypothetical protein